MKTLSSKRNLKGFTLVEMLVVIFVIILLVWFFYSGGSHAKNRVPTIECLSNQKQCALAFSMWQDDHDGKFPWQLSSTNSGTMDSAGEGDDAPNFNVLLAYVHQPRIFVCPT